VKPRLSFDFAEDEPFAAAGVWSRAIAPGRSLVLCTASMSDTLGPGDLVLCVNASPNHVTGEPVPLVAGETYRVLDLWEFACPCGRSDALIDVGVGWAWCQSRFRKLPKPKARERVRRTAKPKEVQPV
jgi:hypothetical protein